MIHSTEIPLQPRMLPVDNLTLPPVPMLLRLLVAAAVISAGCRQGPSRIHQPSIDARRAGRLAMEEYDANGDGAVSGGELNSAPGLKAALANIDQDGDGRITASEVTARVKAWQGARVAVMPILCHVLSDGKPLPDVLVTYEPEAFLGEDIQPATGITNVFGQASMGIAERDRPSQDYPSGVQFGLYKVRITHWPDGSGSLPAKYNTDTTLGQEVSYDDPAVANNRVVYKVTSGEK